MMPITRHKALSTSGCSFCSPSRSGAYMARVYLGKAAFAQRILGPIERLFYRLSALIRTRR